MQTKIYSNCIEFHKLKKTKRLSLVQRWSRAGGEGLQTFLLILGPGLLCPTRPRSPPGLKCGNYSASQTVLIEGSRQIWKILQKGTCEAVWMSSAFRLSLFCCHLMTRYCPKLPELTIQIEIHLSLV